MTHFHIFASLGDPFHVEINFRNDHHYHLRHEAPIAAPSSGRKIVSHQHHNNSNTMHRTMLNGREKTDVPKSFASMSQIESVMTRTTRGEAAASGHLPVGRLINRNGAKNANSMSNTSSSLSESSSSEDPGETIMPEPLPVTSFHLSSHGKIGLVKNNSLIANNGHAGLKRLVSRTPEEKMSTGSDNPGTGSASGGGALTPITATPFTESRLSSEHPDDFVDSCSCTDVTLDENIRINHNHR